MLAVPLVSAVQLFALVVAVGCSACSAVQLFALVVRSSAISAIPLVQLAEMRTKLEKLTTERSSISGLAEQLKKLNRTAKLNELKALQHAM